MSKSKVMTSPKSFRVPPHKRDTTLRTYRLDRASGAYLCTDCGCRRGEKHRPGCPPPSSE